jgi:hypothetical protein
MFNSNLVQNDFYYQVGGSILDEKIIVRSVWSMMYQVCLNFSEFNGVCDFSGRRHSCRRRGACGDFHNGKQGLCRAPRVHGKGPKAHNKVPLLCAFFTHARQRPFVMRSWRRVATKSNWSPPPLRRHPTTFAVSDMERTTKGGAFAVHPSQRTTKVLFEAAVLVTLSCAPCLVHGKVAYIFIFYFHI